MDIKTKIHKQLYDMLLPEHRAYCSYIVDDIIDQVKTYNQNTCTTLLNKLINKQKDNKGE